MPLDADAHRKLRLIIDGAEVLEKAARGVSETCSSLATLHAPDSEVRVLSGEVDRLACAVERFARAVKRAQPTITVARER